MSISQKAKSTSVVQMEGVSNCERTLFFCNGGDRIQGLIVSLKRQAHKIANWLFHRSKANTGHR